MTEKKKHAGIYARYSTEMQREGKSIESQIFRTKKFIEEHGWNLVEIYKDEAQSGQYATRRNFRKIVSDAQAGKLDVVVIDAITRASRFDDVMDYYAWKRELKDAGVDVYSATEDIHNEEIGDLIEYLSLWQSKHEIYNIRKNVKRTLELNASKGKFNGGVPPLGYDIDKNHEYIINEHEAEAVKIIFKMYLGGYGYNTITDKLNLLGYTTKRGSKFGKNSIRDILLNPRYTGRYEYGRTPEPNREGKRNHHSSKPEDQIIKLENRIPIIIDKGDFEMAQERMNQRKRVRNSSTEDTYLLSGVLECGDCGYSMTGRFAKSGNIYYYECVGKKNHKVINCKSTLIRRDPLEEAVVSYLEKIGQNRQEIFEFFNNSVRLIRDVTQSSVASLEARLIQLKAEANSIADKILELDSPTLRAKLKDAEDAISKNEKELSRKLLEQEKVSIVSPEVINEELDILCDLHNYSRLMQKNLIQKYIKKIIVYPGDDPENPKNRKIHIESRLTEKFDTKNIITNLETGLPLQEGEDSIPHKKSRGHCLCFFRFSLTRLRWSSR